MIDNKLNKYEVEDAILMYDTYKVFFGKEPNFDNEKMYSEIQSMVFILIQFGIYIHVNVPPYKFEAIDNTNTPYSFNLEKTINNVKKLDEVINAKSVELMPNAIEEIKIISQYIKDAYDDKENYYKLFAKEVYAKNNADANIQKTKDLVLKIDKKLKEINS